MELTEMEPKSLRAEDAMFMSSQRQQNRVNKEEGVFVKTRLARLLMVGALTFGLFRSTAGAAVLETMQALPAAQQRPAPAFTLPDLQGTLTRLADLQGKVVVVRFWVTW
jgi:cytochrome oxidase Cu insertion factor (SCO1/SenC/PrrC family)